MARLPKLFINGTVLFITTGVEQGLIFPMTSTMRRILRSIIARAQTLHPVRICHFLMEATHLHMLVIVDNPDDIKGFMERFKTESAHAVNALLGRRKRTVWCEGYDSPALLTVEDVIRKIIYLYANPAKDGLVSSIQQYPGLSSWGMFRRQTERVQVQRIHRSEVKRMSSKGHKALLSKLLRRVPQYLSLHPDAWMDGFQVPKEARSALDARIKKEIAQEELQYQKDRDRERRGVVGKERLIARGMDLTYIPQRHGRKMWCICSDIQLRKAYIAWAKALVACGREVYHRWKLGDFSVRYPVGLYPPSFPRQAELLFCAIGC